MIKLSFKKMDEKAILPSCKHKSDAGRDISSIEDVVLHPGKTTIIETGLALQMDWDFPPFAVIDRLPSLLKSEQLDFVNNFAYYQQEYIKQYYKLFFQIESRSGLASKGIHATGGIVDVDYLGELRIILANTGKASYVIKIGDRIAQGIAKIIPKITTIGWVDDFDATDRGENGFGSSGK